MVLFLVVVAGELLQLPDTPWIQCFLILDLKSLVTHYGLVQISRFQEPEQFLAFVKINHERLPKLAGLGDAVLYPRPDLEVRGNLPINDYL